MAILGTLLMVAGPSVAKILLKKYLAGAEPVEIVGGQLADIAAAGLKEEMGRRQAVRTFEGLADKIISQLAPLFEEAGKSENLNIEAVAYELGAALEGRISADLLLANELLPDKLARAFQEVRPLPKGQLSAAEAEFYDRALHQTARYLVSVATQLPRFVERLAVTQLERIARMDAEITLALNRVRMIEEKVALLSPDRTHAQFEADYRQVVSQTVDELELFGVDIDAQSKRYKLSVAYISLSFVEGASNEEDVTLVPAEHLLRRLRPGARRLLVRGEAGSGKSTLFRWMALRVALVGRTDSDDARAVLLDEVPGSIGHGSRPRGLKAPRNHPDLWRRDFPSGSISEFVPDGHASSEDAGIPWDLCVPFLIRLRDCKGGRLPPIVDFTKQTAGQLEVPTGWMTSILKEGRALVLLDGVDEVPNQDRDNLYKDIKKLIDQYPECYYLLSTRPAGAPPGWLEPLGFREAEISPLSEVDRDRLIDRWHAAVTHELALQGRQGEDLVPLAESLKQALRENAPIARLAVNPLLAAMICALYRGRSQRLPENQAELCEALCNMLLHRRERESQLRLEDFPEEYRALSYLQKRAIVGELAEYMVLNNNVSALDRQDAALKVGDVLDTIPGRERHEADTVLDCLIERSGMLREAQPGVVDFIHNTFREFLAGDLLAQRRLDKLLAGNVLEAGWQNIVLFAAARGEKGFVESLLKQVLGESAPQKQPAGERRRARLDAESHQRSLMAVRLRSVVQRLDKTLATRIEELQGALFPPATMADAEALAGLGDAVVPYLRYRSSLSTRGAAACVRALRLINSPAAKDCLKGYLAETRQGVLVELVQAVNPLEIRLVLQELLRSGSIPGEMRGHVSDVTPLAGLTGLQKLFLFGTQVSDVTPLAGLTGLQTLFLSGTQVSDVTPLAGLTGLQTLDLSGTQVSDVTPLAGLTGLQTLDLSDTQVSDVTPLAGLTGLQTLDLSDTQVSDVTPLAGLTGLRVLK